MSQDLLEESFLSVRIATINHYMAAPIEGVDVLYNDQRAAPVKKVPVLRIFGPTAAGQKACLHLHGIFPYLYVPMPKNAAPGFDQKLMASLDRALNLSMGVLESKTQHIYKIEEVSGVPFYGYHPRQHRFLKIFFYNPLLVKRAADMLLNGAVMEKHLQPHEAHVPFTLQFLMDYNLQGMNFIHLGDAKFRRKKVEIDVEPEKEKKSTSSFDQEAASSSDDESSWFHESPSTNPSQKMFHVDKMTDEQLLAESVLRESSCELEIDAVAADILNCNESTADSSSLEGTAGGMNPGLQAIWEDERERRRLLNIDEPLTPPSSPPRPEAGNAPTESELFWKERFLQQLEKLQAASAGTTQSSLDSSDPNATCNMTMSGNEKERVYADETADGADLQSATFVQTHLPALSRGASSVSRRSSLGEVDLFAGSYSDETIVDEDVALSQSQSLSASQRSVLLGDDDQELVDMLAELGQNRAAEDKVKEEDNDLLRMLSQLSSASKKKKEEEVRETLEMSQIISFDDSDEEDKERRDVEKEKSPQPGPSKERSSQRSSQRSADPNASLWGDEEFWNEIDVDKYL